MGTEIRQTEDTTSHPGETIAAIASAAGQSALGIVRVSGPGTLDLLARMCRPAPESPGAHKAVIALAPGIDLPAGVVLFRAPHSYTGEDACELLVPGSPALLERVIGVIVSTGLARHAQAGEFTARAHAAGKLTLSEAEGVSATIAAESEDALRAAHELLTGERGEAAGAIIDELGHLCALVEAGIDFADEEDVVPIAAPELRERLQMLVPRLRSWIAQGAHLTGRTGLPTVALVGEPNAGKSTLFNALLGRTRVVASPVAGTTVDRIAEELVLDARLGSGGRVRLIDTPGVSDLGAAASQADLLLLCDPLGAFTHAGSIPPDAPRLLVRTKADRPATSDSTSGHLSVCALTGAGLDGLRRAIADATPGLRPSGTAAALARHADAYADAAGHLDAACDHLASDEHAVAEPELVAHELRSALDRLGEVSGRVAPDDLLGRIFRSFCIGK